MISSLVTILVFAIIGWYIFRGVKAPKKWWAWVLVILAVIFASFSGSSIILFGFFGFEVHFNNCLTGLGFGAIAAFLIRKKLVNTSCS